MKGVRMSEHALLSPSGAERWMTCPASVVLEATMPDEESEFAAEGTFAHAVASHCLTNKLNATDIESITFKDKVTPVAREMAEHVQEYLDYVWARGAGQHLLIEQRVDIEWVTGEKDAKGTADTIIIADNGEYMHLVDLKYGMGVKVYAQENKQLQLYALGALNQFDMFGDFKKVKLHIHQPRLEHEDEWETDIVALGAFANEVKQAAARVREAQKSNSLEGFYMPSKKACKFCKARAICPALASTVAQATGADFDDLTQKALIEPIDLGAAMDKTDLIEMWIKGVRAKVEAELLAGRKVNGFKLVEGKKGNRQYDDEAVVEAECKAMRLTQDEMYSFKLKSPAQMEKQLKNNPKKWARIQEHIKQKEGKPSVAKSNDPRPPYNSNPSSDFETVGDNKLDIPPFLRRTAK